MPVVSVSDPRLASRVGTRTGGSRLIGVRGQGLGLELRCSGGHEYNLLASWQPEELYPVGPNEDVTGSPDQRDVLRSRPFVKRERFSARFLISTA
jgi:hypothetical protein